MEGVKIIIYEVKSKRSGVGKVTYSISIADIDMDEFIEWANSNNIDWKIEVAFREVVEDGEE